MAPKRTHVPYPFVDSGDFPGDILKKREFDLRDGSSACGKRPFRLQPVQQFVSVFMAPSSPYKSVLLRHGTGVGKTCAAIQVAELHRGRKSVVIVPSSVQGGFEKNIYNPGMIKGEDSAFDASKFQCTGSTYYSNEYENANPAAVQKMVRSSIKSRYDFYGHDMFGNLIESIYQRIDRDFDSSVAEIEKKNTIKTMFDGRLIIIDEAHTLRSSDRGGMKPSYEAVFSVLRHCDNCRLMLLTATPMFDTAGEIVDLINLMRANEGLQLLVRGDLFGNDSLTEEGASEIRRALEGRVSDVSFEDTTFPYQLTPEQAGIKGAAWKPPTKQRNGKPIPASERLQAKSIPELFCSKLSSEQAKARNGMVSEAGVSAMNKLQQIENVCYDSSWNDTNDDAFLRAFSKAGKLRYKYSGGVRYLSPDSIAKHSPKLAAMAKLIKNSAGKCFVYSHYKWSGVFPAAIALEEMGFVPYMSQTMLVDAPKAGSLTAPKYVVITKDDEAEDGLSVTDKVNAFNDPASGIKVVLGTDTASQGLDFKGVREIHILEPWWNMSKIQQVIGRGVRRCSHVHLPADQRNTTVYMHCTVSGTERETQDQHGYRTASNKHRDIRVVERIIAEAAVDCGLYEVKNKPKAELVSSQGKDVVVAGDRREKISCSLKWPSVKDDDSTVHPYVYKNMIDLMAWEIVDILKERDAATFGDIKEVLGADASDYLTSLTLHTLLNPMFNWRWLQNNTLVYRNGLYIVVPRDMENKRFTLMEAKIGHMFGESPSDIRIR